MYGPLLAALVMQLPAAPSPTPAYWQQGVRYEIHATLDEASGVLSGTQRMVYHNHSPDTLRTVSFHLYLNAFRPGSRWADADSVERRRRFNDLRDPDYAFNHVRNARIMGEPVEATWPFAPDSTIVRFMLPRPLAPGDSMTVDLDWDARPSTVPRRQGRRGRAFDFAQSYPKVVVYDRQGWNEHPLYPGGEFYGEFATYLVELDVARDQVMGATGVPICGDPGWAGANQLPDRPIDYRRDYYPDAPRYLQVGSECIPAGDSLRAHDAAIRPDRKRVVWYAEQVHHWALSLNPAYRYEGSAWGKVAIHVLYQPGDEASWGHEVATRRTAIALAWLDDFFGPFAWPQITNLHRIEGGGTEFPMVIMDGSAGQGLIVHELGHNYVMGILANKEWRDGWLDEGFSDYQQARFDEANQPGLDAYGQSEPFLTGLDLDGRSEPPSLPGEDYRDFNSYGISIYTRGEAFFHQLEYVVGPETMRRIMHLFYDRWQLKHVNEAAFREVAEEVSHRDLSTLFGQALHGTPLVDYAVGRVAVRRSVGPSGGWQSQVEVVRKAAGMLPVEVWVIGQADTAMVRAEGTAAQEWVTVETRSRPKQVLLDPRLRTHDWNMLNNTWRRGILWPVREPKTDWYLDTYLSERTHRDRRALGLAPTAWYNDAGGLTFGVRTRSNYFGRFAEDVGYSTWSTGLANPRSRRDAKDADWFMRMQNPTWLRSPGLSQMVEGFRVEGRYGGRIAVERTQRDHLFWGPVRTIGASLTWFVPDDFRYLEPGFYERAGTVELGMSGGLRDQNRGWDLVTRVTAAGGLAYNGRGLSLATGRPGLDPFYGRITLEASGRKEVRPRWILGARFYGGVSTSGHAPVKQRQIYLAGADPLERFYNPFLRSTGALLVRPDFFYHDAGGGNLRGFAPTLSAQGLVALNLELERTLLARGHARLFRRVALAVFGDAGHSFDDPGLSRFLADAGLGLRLDHQLGQTAFTTRADFPLLVNRPALAQDTHPGSDRAGFRWTVSFSPTW